MQSIIALAAFAGVVAAHGNYTQPAGTSVAVVTTVVSDYTTYCPTPTVFTEGTQTFTVTSATHITVTDCPCTRTSTLSGAGKPYTTSVTEYVTEIITTCPVATSTVVNSVTHSGTAGQVLTINNCPCPTVKETVVTPGVPATTTSLVTQTTVVSSYTTSVESSTVLVVPGPTSTETVTATPSQVVTFSQGLYTQTIVTQTPVVFTPSAAPVESAPAGSPAPAPAPSASGAPIAPSAAPSPFTGGAAKVAGMGFGGILGLLAYIL